MTNTITIYSTTTCATCKVASRRLDAAGIEHEKVELDLPEHAEKLEDLKRLLKVDKINVPLIEYGTKRVQIDGLTDIIAKYQEKHA